MAGFVNDVSMQEYFGSFPTTSNATAVSRSVGIKKIQATPNLNAMGPSGEDRDDDIVERVLAQNISPTQANLTPNQMSIYRARVASQGLPPTDTSGSGTDSQNANQPAAAPKNTMIYVLAGAALLLGYMVYRKLRK
jgi:hypothetical protein